MKGRAQNSGYSEIVYFDEAGNIVDAARAARCVIHEYDSAGILVFETIGICSKAVEAEIAKGDCER